MMHERSQEGHRFTFAKEFWYLTTILLFPGDEAKPNVEVIILVCTGAAATFLWIMLILFIRKLRKVKDYIMLFLTSRVNHSTK